MVDPTQTRDDEFDQEAPEKPSFSMPEGPAKIIIQGIDTVDFTLAKNKRRDPNECRYNLSIQFKYEGLKDTQTFDFFFNIKRDAEGSIIWARDKDSNPGLFRFNDMMKGIGVPFQIGKTGRIKVGKDIAANLEEAIELINLWIIKAGVDISAWTYIYKRPDSKYSNFMTPVFRTAQEAEEEFERSKDFLLKPLRKTSGKEGSSNSVTEGADDIPTV